MILGNRDFFPDALVAEARRDLVKLFAEMSIEPVWLSPTRDEAGRGGNVAGCSEVRRTVPGATATGIDGMLVCLPNFGDEKGVADAIRLAEVQVPDPGPGVSGRSGSVWPEPAPRCVLREDFGLQQPAPVRFQVHPDARSHSGDSGSERFREDLAEFLQVCRMVRGLRRVRIGAVGARPNAFNTTRYSEKLLEAAGISVNTIDLSEVFGQAAQDCQRAMRGFKQRVDQIRAYADCFVRSG